MSLWIELQMKERILEVLQDVKSEPGAEDFYGRPLLTAHQIAIELCKRDPGLLEKTGMVLGGEGTSEQSALARYIANQLGKKMKEGEITEIEAFYLDNRNVKEIDFVDHEGNEMEVNSWSDIRLYRLKE